MDIVTTLRTTGAVRAFTDEPVADDVVHELLDDARFAPSGGNRQPWRVTVVKDRAIRRRIGELMQPVWDGYVARAALGVTPYNCIDDREPATTPRVPLALLDRIEAVPVVLAIAADLRRIALMDSGLDRPSLASPSVSCLEILAAKHSDRAWRRGGSRRIPRTKHPYRRRHPSGSRWISRTKHSGQ